MKTVFNITYYRKNGTYVDTTQVDELSEELIWDLYSEFGHTKKPGDFYEHEETTEDEDEQPELTRVRIQTIVTIEYNAAETSLQEMIEGFEEGLRTSFVDDVHITDIESTKQLPEIITETRVLFMVNEDENDSFAFFPDIPETKGTFLCYARLGQHSQCSPEYLHKCRTATKHEYESLLHELKSVGYTDLRIITWNEYLTK